jgi:predicted metal-dependent peptidase
MNKMVRQQLFITAEQKKRLKARAAATGKSEGEIMRRGIDRELDDKPTEAEGDWKDAWRQAFGMWKDRDDLDEFYANRRKLRRKRRQRVQKLARGD